MLRISLKPLDWVLLIFAIALVVLLSIHSAGGGESEVRIDGADESWIYPLDAEVELAVPGPLGITHVHLHDGKVWVSDSPCRQKVCIAAGEISSAGAFIACLPIKVLIRIEGRAEGDVDGFAF